MTTISGIQTLPITSGTGQTIQVKTAEDGQLLDKQQLQTYQNKQIALEKDQLASAENISIGKIESHEEMLLRVTNDFNNANKNLETIGNQMYEMDRLTAEALSEIAKETPALMGKQFDFTLKEGKIEVVDHNLTAKEKTELENKLNENSELVETLGKLNESLAEKYKVDGEEIEGRLKVLEFQDRVSNYVYNTLGGGDSSSKKAVFEGNYANRYASAGAVSQVLKYNFSAPVSTKV